MDESQLDPEKGREVADQLRKLGVRGILVTAAEQGYITALACQMPTCHCPDELGGPRFFDRVPAALPDWMPTQDHINLKSAGGKLTVDNVRLAHRLCNRVDYARNQGKPFDKDLARVEAARSLAIESKRRAGIPRDERWPGRRTRILAQITALWDQLPGMRFGQLVEVALSTDTAELFNLEDYEIETRFQSALDKHRSAP